MTRMDGERYKPTHSFSALVRNHRDFSCEQRSSCACLVGSDQRRFNLLVPAAARNLFPRWKAFNGEVPMLTSVSCRDASLVGAS